MRRIFVICLLVLPFYITSCVSYTYYHPTNSVVPKIREQSDLQVAGGLAATDQFEHVSAEVNYQYDSNSYFGSQLYLSMEIVDGNSRGDIEQKANYMELTHGQIYSFREDEDFLHFYHSYSMGYGNVYNRYKTAWKSLDYIKPNTRAVLALNSGIADLGIGAQLSSLYFFDIVDKGGVEAQGTVYENDLENLRKEPFCLTIQPSISLGLGWNDFKIVSQYSYAPFVIGGHNIKHDEQCFTLGFTYVFKNAFVGL